MKNRVLTSTAMALAMWAMPAHAQTADETQTDTTGEDATTAQPQPRGGQQAGIAPGLRTTEQVQQLAILGTRTRLRAGLVAQDCGEAIVELHGGEGRKLLR